MCKILTERLLCTSILQNIIQKVYLPYIGYNSSLGLKKLIKKLDERYQRNGSKKSAAAFRAFPRIIRSLSKCPPKPSWAINPDYHSSPFFYAFVLYSNSYPPRPLDLMQTPHACVLCILLEIQMLLHILIILHLPYLTGVSFTDYA